MIYHNYSPYYYSTPSYLNKNFLNAPNGLTQYSNYKNHNPSVPYNNRAPTFSTNSKPYNQKHLKNNNHKNNIKLTQPLTQTKEKTLKQNKIPPKSNDDMVFEILGIKLYFDDLLLICLIFFLYNEGVQDQYLFIALILLLLS